jgi:hypothetical protein
MSIVNLPGKLLDVFSNLLNDNNLMEWCHVFMIKDKSKIVILHCFYEELPNKASEQINAIELRINFIVPNFIYKS